MSEKKLLLKRAATGDEYELIGTVVIGRKEGSDIKLLEESGSRHHATVSVTDGVAYLEDERSRFGTTINAKTLAPKTLTRLSRGDRVKFNTEEFLFREEGPDETIAQPRMAVPSANGIPANKPPWVDSAGYNTKESDGTERITAEELAKYDERLKRIREETELLDVREPCLRITLPGQSEFTVPLIVDESPVQHWTIGRGADSAVRLDEDTVSHQHAKLVRERLGTRSRWKVLDAIASNGTYVNDLPVGMCYLDNGYVMRFGRAQCVLNLPKKTKDRVNGNGPNIKQLFIVGLSVSFLVTLLIMAWFFRYWIM